MRIVIRFFTFSLATLLAGFIGLFFYLQNTERLKPEVESLIADQMGITVRIHGDLRWQLLPPLTLAIKDLEVIDGSIRARAESLDLAMDLSAMWQDTNQWKVDALHLTNTVISDGTSSATLTGVELTDFRPGAPAQLMATGHYLPPGAPDAYTGTLQGILIYEPATEASPARIRLEATELKSEAFTTVCNLAASENGQTLAQSAASDTGLLPVAVLRGIDLTTECAISELNVAGQKFTNGAFKLTNLADTLSLSFELPDFFNGQAAAEVSVDLAARPISWAITPHIDRVDSKRLLDWADQSIHWVAPVALKGQIQMVGNSQTEWVESLQSNLVFDGGTGEIDITELKQQLAKLSVLTGNADAFAQWPETWVYDTFTGTLLTQGRQQTLSGQLDNLTLEGQGTYDYAADRIDMMADVMFKKAPQGSPYVINPMLQDTPLPVRCRGKTASLSCKLDGDATQALIANALKRDSDTGLRRKLEDKIDEKVPEQYREAARGLLDIIGRALDND